MPRPLLPESPCEPPAPPTPVAAVAAEFSRFYRVESIGTRKMAVTLEATAAECAALARRFDLLELSDVRAQLELRRAEDGARIRVTGHVQAQVVQRCVVTLEPVAAEVEERFSALFASEAESSRLADGRIIDVVFSCDGDADEEPEPLEDGGIDLGELTAQHLSLALDPYPRAPGVPALVLREDADDEAEAEAEANADTGMQAGPKAKPHPGGTDVDVKIVTNVTNPFAALARWRQGS